MTDRAATSKKRIAADLDQPVFTDMLEKTRADSAQLASVALVDVVSQRGVLCAADDEPTDCDTAIAVARDLLGEGDGSALHTLTGQADTVDFAALQVDGQWLLVLPLAAPSVALVCLNTHCKPHTLQAHAKKLTAGLQQQPLTQAMEKHASAMRGWVFDLEQQAVTAEYRRPGSEQQKSLEGVDALHPLQQLGALVIALRRSAANLPARQWLRGVWLQIGDSLNLWQRLPFLPDHVLWVKSTDLQWSESTVQSLERLQESVLRQVIADVLAGGLETRIDPFPDTDIQFKEIVDELQHLDAGDLTGRLVVGGFADHPIGEGEDRMRCQECIYYLPNRRWCDLPELPLPVEADWFCRLWKI